MKRLLLFLFLFALMIQPFLAQNWAPITSDETFHFQSDIANFISHSIYVDSVDFNELDSVFYFNKIIKKCDTCFSEELLNDFFEIEGSGMKINQESFLGSHVLISNDMHWNFQGQHPFLIQAHAGLYETWVFNEDGITAEVLDVYESNIFGTLDSLKTISLSSGEIILLSKNHGLLSLPNFHSDEEESAFEMVGIKERDLGLQLLEFEDIFSYEVGDIYQYKKTKKIGLSQAEESEYTNCNGILKLKVLEVNSTDDFIEVTFQRTVRDTCLNLIISEYFYEMHQDTVIFMYSKSNYDDYKENPNDVTLSEDIFSPISYDDFFSEESAYGSNANLTMTSFLASDGKTIEFFGSYEYFDEQQDHKSIVFQEESPTFNELEDPDIVFAADEFLFQYLYAAIGGGSSRHVGFSFGEDLGVTSFEYSDNSWMGGFNDDEYYSLGMNAYQTNEGSAGEIISDDVLLGVEDYATFLNYEMKVFPNPAQDVIFVETSVYNSKDLEIRIYDSALRLVLTNRGCSIDVSELHTGLYFMQIEVSGDLVIRKMIIE